MDANKYPQEFKPLEKYHAITSLIAALNDSKINLDKIIINDFCKYVEWYRLDYLQKKSIKKYNRLAGESQGYHYRNEDVEISLYEFVQSKSYLPCIRRDVIYTTTYADTDDNRHRRSGTFYRNKKFNYADFEEEKSIYS